MKGRHATGRAQVILSSLARDPFVLAFLGLGLVEGLAVVSAQAGLIPWRPPAAADQVWLRLPFHVLRVCAAFAGLSAIADRNERRFWTYFGAAFSVWFLARVATIIVPGREFQAAIDFMLLAGDLLLLLAIERKPHEEHPPGPLDLNRRLKSIAVSCVAGGFFLYFVLVPNLLVPAKGTSRLGYFIYLAIDALLIARFVSVYHSCRHPRWRGLYAALAVAIIVNGAVDFLDILLVESQSRWSTSAIATLLPFITIFSLMVAVRFRHVPPALPDRGAPAAAGSADLDPLGTGSVLLASALLFPLVHIVVYAVMQPDPLLARAHSLAALGSMTVLGVAAVIAYRVLERQHARQEEARRLAESRVQMARRMEEAGQVAGGVAHDFNNLLMAISGYADLARQNLAVGHPSLALVEQIERSAARAQDLTRQLLAFSRREGVRVGIEDFNAIVNRVASALGGWLGEDIAVSVSLAPRADLLVRADAGDIESILLNLAASARHSMPAGGSFVVTTRRVDLDADLLSGLGLAPGPYVELTVRDTGEAVSPDMLPRLFEPFVAPAGRFRGSGLNLAAAYGLVTQSGGGIWASLPPEGGVAYTIVLPLAFTEPGDTVGHA